MAYELLISDPKLIKPIKTLLEKTNELIKPIYSESGNKIVRTTITELDSITSRFPDIPYREYSMTEISQLCSSDSKKRDILGFSEQYFKKYLGDDMNGLEKLLSHIPIKYSVYPPIILFNNSTLRSFLNEDFKLTILENNIDMNDYYFTLLKDFFQMDRDINIIAINKPILESDTMRQPHNLILLYKEDPNLQDENIWCQLKQNGIWQVWNPMFTMFSRGNIKEKKRILDTFKDVPGNDVVDLYCGIGYFSFSYMKLGCRNLFGFELNKWSVDGFSKGFMLNKKFGYYERDGGCHVYNENNEMCIQRLQEYRDNNSSKLLRIRHINLGLLPSSKQGWPIMLNLLAKHHNWNDCPTVSTHIHENVDIESIENGIFISQTLSELRHLAQNDLATQEFRFTSIHLEKIKTFAPDIWHICLDIDITGVA